MYPVSCLRIDRTGNHGAAPATAELMYGEATRARTASARIAIGAAQADAGP